MGNSNDYILYRYINIRALIFQVDFSILLQQEGLVYQSYQVESLKSIQDARPAEPCPYFVEPLQPKPGYEDSNHIVIPDEKIFVRQSLIPLGRFYPTYLLWVNDTADVLAIFDKTVLKCEQKIDTGIYNRQAKFLFVVDQGKKDLDDVFAKNEYLTKHRNVAIIQSLPYGVDQKFKVYSNNLAKHDGEEKLIFSHLWSTSNRFKGLDDIFVPASDLKGELLLHLLPT